ncbi:MAG: class I SAM-dependent methyltransferase [Anaerolineales bacterium]|nr:class I SAM-dependent methyltransferase [Anaerolineales bacterium]
MDIKNKLANLSQLVRSSALGLNMRASGQPLKSSHLSQSPDSTLLDSIPLDQSLTDRWDREWLTYFLTENPRPFLVDHHHLRLIDNVRRKEAVEIYNTALVSVQGVEGLLSLGALGIWVKGADLVRKNVLEIGCGPGFLGKQLGMIAAAYVGIDYSKLALSIARLTSPPNCFYYHLADLSQITQHAGTMDTMVGRNFFIHQNYENLLWILQLAYMLLKPGGLMSADFYQGNPAIPQGVVHLARNKLDPRYPSCAFEFSIQEIEQAAKEAGFTVQNVTDNLDLQRRFVFFIKYPG